RMMGILADPRRDWQSAVRDWHGRWGRHGPTLEGCSGSVELEALGNEPSQRRRHDHSHDEPCCGGKRYGRLGWLRVLAPAMEHGTDEILLLIYDVEQNGRDV